MIDTVLNYLQRGWKVIPLYWIRDGRCTCNRACESPGKHPIPKLAPNGSRSATGNPQTAKDWWKMFPEANVGIATGEESGLVVLDVDPRHGGSDSIQDLIERHGNFTHTLSSQTGSGGYHYYFRHPGYLVRNSVGALGQGIDVRGEGGYVVAPPSSHAEGSYGWVYDDIDISAMPGWISAKDNTKSSAPTKIPGMIPKGVQHDTLVSIAGTARRRGCTENEIYALVSEVNKRCEEPGPDSNMRKIASSMMQYSPEEIIGVIEEVKTDLSGQPAFVSIGDAVREALERADKLRGTNKLPGLEMGFDMLDDMLLGAQPSELIVLAARPSMGKTAMAVQLARTLAPQSPGAIFSIEMARLAIANRFLSAESEVDSQDIRRGSLTDGAFDALVRAASSLGDLPIYLNDESGITTRRMLTTLSEIDNLGWMIVDYLQLAEVAEKNQLREQDVAEISRDLKGIAKRYDIPVIALAQLSRKNESRGDKRPMLSDLRESGQIEQDADVVLFIHRPEKYGETHMEAGGATVKSAGLAEIIVAKQRNGPVGSVVLCFEEKLARFTDYDRIKHMTPSQAYADVPF